MTKTRPTNGFLKKWVLCQKKNMTNKKRKTGDQEKSNKTETISNEDQSLSKEIHEDIWECFDEIVNKTKEGESESNSCSEVSEPGNSRESSPLQGIAEDSFNSKFKKIKTEHKKELERYLAESLIPRKEDPIIWWKKNREKYPILLKLALKYLSAPPSSVSSERLFSAAKRNIYRKPKQIKTIKCREASIHNEKSEVNSPVIVSN